jgi:hypothetical protein
MRIGVISDTHGLLRPAALTALAGVEHILHAGDVGDIAILEALAKIAPVTAIRGNIDTSGPCADLPPTEFIEVGGAAFYLIHDLHDLDINPTAAQISCVISGHSHRSSIETRNAVLYLNPGSAGPRRFFLPITLALVDIENGRVTPQIIPLEPA